MESLVFNIPNPAPCTNLLFEIVKATMQLALPDGANIASIRTQVNSNCSSAYTLIEVEEAMRNGVRLGVLNKLAEDPELLVCVNAYMTDVRPTNIEYFIRPGQPDSPFNCY